MSDNSFLSVIPSKPHLIMQGAIIYSGPSQIRDGGEPAPIVVVLTFDSGNSKTGGLSQTTILRTDMKPGVARACGADAAVCGSCPLRPSDGGGCYVSPMALASIWGRLNRADFFAHGISPYLQVPESALAQIFEGWLLRVGTYGDPTAVPIRIWHKLLTRAGAWTGYTHHWAHNPGFGEFCMASVDSLEQREHAKDLGWRTFRVQPWNSDAPPARGEIVCPASAEGGSRLQCSTCLICGGTEGRRGPDVVIRAHGQGKKRVAALDGWDAA